MNTEDAILNRKTVKILGDEHAPLKIETAVKEVVDEMIRIAGAAPFHYACHKSYREKGEMTSIVPWRFHALAADDCRKLLGWIQQHDLVAGKVAKMLATADALLLVTWLPDVSDEKRDELFVPTLRNMEHIAAASAAIQNLLLIATSKGVDSYWSSGGVLREKELFQLLKIPLQELLLGAVFLFPADSSSAEKVAGKLRNLRGEKEKWSRWVQLGD